MCRLQRSNLVLDDFFLLQDDLFFIQPQIKQYLDALIQNEHRTQRGIIVRIEPPLFVQTQF